MTLATAHSAHDLDEVLAAWQDSGLTWALVPTMGALHAGHGALVHEAAQHYDRVVVSIFVNPLQFGEGEDFEAYPRGLEQDQVFLDDYPAHLVFAPGLNDMYPEGAGSQERLHAGPVGDTFEGASRPGHFDGVLTVVNRLCELVRPAGIVFGAKDAQQVFVVRRMLAKRHPSMMVHEVDTVRDTDGLALSSRNVFLSAREREHARAIPRALAAAERALTPSQAKAAAVAEIQSERGCQIDYVEIVDPETFLPVRDSSDVVRGRLICAVWVGGTRLIDNQLLHFAQ